MHGMWIVAFMVKLDFIGLVEIIRENVKNARD